MPVLVLNRFLFTDAPYHEYVPRDVTAVLVTASRSLPPDPAERRAVLAPFEEAVVVDDYDDAPAVEVLAHRLHQRYRFDAVVALSEYDILRAARLRDAWGTAGQGLESALAFRDKLDMKRRLRAAGVPVAEFAPVSSATDLLAFVDRVGWPVVVKPRRGAASVGVDVLRDDDEMAAWLEGPALRGDAPADLLAEEYLPHRMHGVDGVVDGGRVVAACPSTYEATCLDFHDGVVLRSVMCDRDDPVAGELTALVGRALHALPLPAVTLFHAEVFAHRERGLVFNEVGSRIGGAGILDQLRAAYGVDPLAWFVRREVGDPRLDPFPADWSACAGWALVPPRPGRLVGLAEDCRVPGLVRCDVRARPGDDLPAASSSVHALALFAAVGADAAQVRSRLADACRWFEAGTTIEPAVPVAAGAA